MENERRIDRTTSMGMDEHRLSDILHASQIKATDIYETPPQIIWIDNSTIATLGNFSASTGKAKSKKTFNVSALVAASLAGKQVLNYRAHLPEGKQRILYVDTEQSRFHCRSVLERILRLAGLPTTTDPENLDFFCLREYSPSVRIEVIDYALRQQKGYGLVIIDGIRDLMLDINNAGESVEVINRMMEWSSRYDLHIHCVLHLNKGDNNVRGHIGTEMSNKAETVLVISKSNENPGISEVHALHIREKEFKPFAFRNIKHKSDQGCSFVIFTKDMHDIANPDIITLLVEYPIIHFMICPLIRQRDTHIECRFAIFRMHTVNPVLYCFKAIRCPT